MKLDHRLLGLLVALGVFAACNTAQISTPPLVDAGPPCPEKAPVFSTTDGGVCERGTFPTGCTGGMLVALDVPDASNVIPEDGGGYAQYCTVGFFIQDPGASDCIRAHACTCAPADSGVTDGGDAGVALPGVWTCTE